MTHAIRVHQPGGPEVMIYEDVALAPPGDHDVQVRHKAIGLNYIDTYFRSGLYAAPAYPFTPGNEAAGEVTRVGARVKNLKEGDRVAYYAGSPGAYAQERNIEARHVLKLPKKIGFDTAAGMMLKGLTAQYLLKQTFKVKRKHTILVHAAAGGVGLILCQWAHAIGATVIGTVGSPEKAELAKANGADHTILYRDAGVDVAAAVKGITGGEQCDVVYDGVGKATFPGSLDCLRPLGTFVSFGSASGQIEAFNINLLSQKGSLFATRPTLGTYTAARADYEEMAEDLFDVVGSGDVDIAVHATYALDQAANAHRALEARQTTGSTILTP